MRDAWFPWCAMLPWQRSRKFLSRNNAAWRAFFTYQKRCWPSVWTYLPFTKIPQEKRLDICLWKMQSRANIMIDTADRTTSAFGSRRNTAGCIHRKNINTSRVRIILLTRIHISSAGITRDRVSYVWRWLGSMRIPYARAKRFGFTLTNIRIWSRAYQWYWIHGNWRKVERHNKCIYNKRHALETSIQLCLFPQ